MSASYPSSKKTWIDKIDKVVGVTEGDDIMAADVNDAYAEIIAIEDELLNRKTTIVQLDTEPTGIIEGRLWLDGSESGTQSITTTQSVKAVKMTNQSIESGSIITIDFDSEEFDTNTLHDNSINNSRLTCKIAGIYLCTLQIDFEENVTGSRAVQLLKNGTIAISGTQANALQVGDTVVTILGVCQLAINDYVEGQAYQSSGGALNVQGNVLGTFLTMTKIG